jgi:Protein of unknown function (DUF2971)
MRLYQFFCKHYALENIKDRRTKISHIQDLNDPFEALSFRLPDKSVRNRFENERRRFSERYGLLCFSKTWSNALMWSHYADRHRGLCLGFDVSNKHLVHVTYDAHRLFDKEGRLKLTIDENTILDCLRTKYASWSYEQEVRCIEPIEHAKKEGSLYFMVFSENLKLAEIVIGPRLKGARSEIEAALGESGSCVEIVNSRLAFNSFRVVRQNDKKLWS